MHLNSKILRFLIWGFLACGGLYGDETPGAEGKQLLEFLNRIQHVTKSADLQYEYEVERLFFGQKIKRKYYQSGSNIAYYSELLEGKLTYIEGDKLVPFELEDPLFEIIAFDGLRFQQFGRGPSLSLLQFGSELSDWAVPGMYSGLTENPMYAPAANLMASLPIPKMEITEFLVQGKSLSLDTLTMLSKIGNKNDFNVKALDGERDFRIVIKWLESEGVLESMTVDRSDGSKTVFEYREYSRLEPGGIQILVPSEVICRTSLAEKSESSSADYRAVFKKETIKSSGQLIGRETFTIPTGLADIVRDEDFGKTLKFPSE